MPTHRYGEEISLAAILAVKRSAGVAPEVNCREHVTHMPLPSVSKAAYSGFEHRGDVTRSLIQRYQCPTKMTYVLQK